ncbi:transmembrane and coiled-coil domains 1 family protein [Acanthamoeba castellanii str. Neff]|uniref:Transmembrane and coiled-coil domains 1 family protein n=1 Tax=Acanthamoeba castellanii (strain ATCC 30010 / Neff) TaxID=1257118 RepID=L8HJY2_ACACF|nr:transmembrane and coiled-coil domains 1 family protein [Acanthamoeba castellanii str. Neff]ELR24988.1 transmembrane and coiled-coil domains 1 family protein [Acanthamoeba castellanii str. Neff]
MVWDCVQIFAISLASAVTAEVLSWLLIYRTESYSSLQGKVEKLTKKLEKKKDGPQSIDKKKSRDKRIVQYEQQLQEANRELTQSKMKSMFVIGITLVSLFGVINSSFGGLVVARLPFEPMPLVRSISHRGLLGVDYYECSAAFIYALCSMSLRTSVQKLSFELVFVVTDERVGTAQSLRERCAESLDVLVPPDPNHPSRTQPPTMKRPLSRSHERRTLSVESLKVTRVIWERATRFRFWVMVPGAVRAPMKM